MRISPIYRLAAVALLLTALFLASCTSQKQILTRQLTETRSTLASAQDSLAVLTREAARLESELRELQYSILQFDESPCPEIRIPEGAALLNADSVNRLIADLNAALSGANNQLQVYADGSFKAQGRITRFQQDLSRTIRQLQEITRQRDSLVASRQDAKTEEKIVYRDREKIVERTVFPWWFWLIVVAGIWLGWRIRGAGKFRLNLDPNQTGRR